MDDASRVILAGPKCPNRSAGDTIGRVTSRAVRRRVPIAACLVAALVAAPPPSARADLRADELVLVVNRNQPAGVELAQFYARLRHVPDGRILALDLPTGDDVPAKDYARDVVPAVRAFLHDHGLDAKVRCLVTFYGVPLRIAGRKNTPPEAAEFADTRATLDQLPDRIRPGVEAVEALARRLDPTFTPVPGLKMDDLDRRWSLATQDVAAQLPTIPDPARRADLTRQFFLAAAPLLGKEAEVRAGQIAIALHPQKRATDGPPLQALAAAYQRATAEAAACEATPEDAPARAKLRALAEGNFGLLPYAKLLHDQLDYLDERHGGQALDSELSLVHWPVHAHNYPGGSPYAAAANGEGQRWFGNPLNYIHVLTPHPAQPPTLMVTRLDGPTPQIVKELMAASVRVEQAGLHGKVVIDTFGAKPGQDPAGHVGYGPYETMMRDLRDLLAHRPGVDVVFDAKPEVLPAHSVSDVALYCGWYSLGQYVPACDFVPGAVAMHISSYAMVNLRAAGGAGGQWAAGMLGDGAAAVIGPVAEPYLFAFPRPDEFYPLLLTGKLTLAEVYWRTEAVASWQMACVGDPLYTPYKADPVLTVADLPLRLRALFSVPATVPATAPAVPVKGSPPVGR